jgi:UDP:flavonoid glycosyltransferase YjiC (YdhE family)
MKRALAQTWDTLESANERFDVVIGNTVSMPAMTWAEHAGVPRLIVHVQPLPVRSTNDVPLMARGLEWTTRLSPRAAVTWFRVADAMTRLLMVPLNVFRRRHGLGTVQSFDALWRSAEGAAALYPAWLAAPQPDWPSNLRQFGTLRPSGRDIAALPEAVERFLSEGDAPIVWTQGSYNVDLASLAALARVATTHLRARSIVLGLEEKPSDDRDFIHVPYASLAALLPRSRALVHHGGIGTGLEAVAAGIPQLIVPRAADHHDNARRFVRAGVAMSVAVGRFDAASAADALRGLLASETIASACRRLGAQLAAADPAPALCAYAEEIALRRA